LEFFLQQGLASGLETLCGQTYGAKQYHLVGIYLQRAIFALFLVAIPICVVSFYMAPIRVAIGEDLADCSWWTSLWQVAGACILGYAFMMPLIKFYQSQHIVFPLMCCTTAAFLLQFPMCFLLITKLKLASQGGAMLTSILIVLHTGILATFLRFSSKCKKFLKSFLIKALHDFTGFFEVALPSALMMW